PDTSTPSLHDALPISDPASHASILPYPAERGGVQAWTGSGTAWSGTRSAEQLGQGYAGVGQPDRVDRLGGAYQLLDLVGYVPDVDRKSTRLNSSHVKI